MFVKLVEGRGRVQGSAVKQRQARDDLQRFLGDAYFSSNGVLSWRIKLPIGKERYTWRHMCVVFPPEMEMYRGEQHTVDLEPAALEAVLKERREAAEQARW